MKMSYNNMSVLFTGTGARALCASQSFNVSGHYVVMLRILKYILNNFRKGEIQRICGYGCNEDIYGSVRPADGQYVSDQELPDLVWYMWLYDITI